MTSYQKLKKRISELEEREIELINDIYKLTRVVTFSEQIMTETKWNIYFDSQEILWHGCIKSKKTL